MTLDDLERQKRTLAEKKSFHGAHQKKLNKGIDPYYQRQNVG